MSKKSEEAVLRRLDSFSRFISLHAPGVIVTDAAWMLFKACLVHYGAETGKLMMLSITSSEREGMNLCRTDKCDGELYKFGLCKKCYEEMVDIERMLEDEDEQE